MGSLKGRVWDKNLDAVGLLWEMIPGGRSGGLEKNGKWKERKPIQGLIIKPVTAVGTWSLVLSRTLWELCELSLKEVDIYLSIYVNIYVYVCLFLFLNHLANACCHIVDS